MGQKMRVELQKFVLCPHEQQQAQRGMPIFMDAFLKKQITRPMLTERLMNVFILDPV